MSSASQTLTSGKLDEVIYLLVRQVEGLSERGHNGRIEGQPALRTRSLGFCDHLLNPVQNELPRGAALAGGGFTQLAVQRPRDIHAGPNRLGVLHTPSLARLTYLSQTLHPLAHQHEPCPIKRMPELRIPHGVQRRLLYRLDLAFVPQAAMEREHEVRGALRLHLPLARHRGGSARNEERPRHPDQSLAAAE